MASTTVSRQGGTAAASGPRFERILVWQAPIRIFHWINAAAITVLFLTGLYIASPDPLDQRRTVG